MRHLIDIVLQADVTSRQFQTLIKGELDRKGFRDINPIQAMLLFKIGNAELKVGDLRLSGCYVGSNVCYNVKQLITRGYLTARAGKADRRNHLVRTSELGNRVREAVAAVIAAQDESELSPSEIEKTVAALRRMEFSLARACGRSWWQRGA